jgi:RNA polymerase sigma-70 factor (ECF subfamily)
VVAVDLSGFEGVLAAAQEGSEWAWEILVRNYGSRLKRFFSIRGIADPEALVSDVFADMARNLGTFSGDEDSFRSWVFVIAYRRMSDERRRLSRRLDEIPTATVPESSERAPSAEDEAMKALAEAEAERILDVLTDSQRDAVSLRVVGGLSLNETAAVMGKPVGAVKGLQRRAIATLRRVFSQQGVPN